MFRGGSGARFKSGFSFNPDRLVDPADRPDINSKNPKARIAALDLQVQERLKRKELEELDAVDNYSMLNQWRDPYTF